MKTGGSGILIIESYNGTNVVTLFEDKKGMCADLGGYIDKGENPEEAACREAQEESANLLTIKPDQLLKIGRPSNIGGYISYIIYVMGLSRKTYKNNLKQIERKCKQKHWKETRKMIRFPLNNIINISQQHIQITSDVDGKQRTIRDRTTAIIRKGVNLINQLIMGKPHVLRRKKIKKSDMKCLIGTTTFKIDRYSLSLLGTNYHPQTVYRNPTQGISYGIYVAPKLTSRTEPFLVNCNPTWGGMHITLVGFSYNNPEILNFLSQMAFNGTRPWSVNVNTLFVNKNTINFKSNTLDRIADYLAYNGFTNVKGPKYSNFMWHMSSDCPVPYDIKRVMLSTNWVLVKVSSHNGIIRWHEQLPLMI